LALPGASGVCRRVSIANAVGSVDLSENSEPSVRVSTTLDSSAICLGELRAGLDGDSSIQPVLPQHAYYHTHPCSRHSVFVLPRRLWLRTLPLSASSSVVLAGLVTDDVHVRTTLLSTLQYL